MKRYREMTDDELVKYTFAQWRESLTIALAARLKQRQVEDRRARQPRPQAGRPHLRVSPGTMGPLGHALWRCEWWGTVTHGVSPLDAYQGWQDRVQQDERKRIG